MRASWDVVVIGAGPAGSLAARAATLAGARTLLVDKARFPRGKVCGCCVNRAALGTLGAEGLGDLVHRKGARPLRRVCVASGGRMVQLTWPGGVALSRERLDQALIEAAVAAGAEFQPGTVARLSQTTGPDDASRMVLLNGRSVTASVVVVADGLGGRSLEDEPALTPRTRPRARLGLGATLHEPRLSDDGGTIHMAVGRDGYVGMVQLEDGRVDLAAAVDPDRMRRHVSAADAVAALWDQAGFGAVADLNLRGLRWRGTPRLTRIRNVAGWRVLVAGDAAGYVEPFTGEGMAWALATGAAVGRLAAQPWTDQTAPRWRAIHRRLTVRRRLLCRAITLALRRPAMVRLAVQALTWQPRLACPLIAWINPPFRARPW